MQVTLLSTLQLFFCNPFLNPTIQFFRNRLLQFRLVVRIGDCGNGEAASVINGVSRKTGANAIGESLLLTDTIAKS